LNRDRSKPAGVSWPPAARPVRLGRQVGQVPRLGQDNRLDEP
jgi:hypothetical protein